MLTALVSLQAFAVFFLENAHGMEPDEAQTAQFPLILTVAVAALLSAVPGGWISSRIGRKPVLYVAIGLGIAGAAVIAIAPAYWMVVAAAVPIGICSGVFLGVDWALMTDIIPKAESGRYMGISNIAVAGAGPIAATVGGVAVFLASLASLGPDLAYRGIFVLMAVELLIGAWALRRVTEPARGATADAPSRLHRRRDPADRGAARASRATIRARWSSTGAIGPCGGRCGSSCGSSTGCGRWTRIGCRTRRTAWSSTTTAAGTRCW